MTTDTILAPIAALTLPDAAGLTTRAQQALEFIDAYVVDSDEAFALAAEELKAIKARAHALEEQRTSITGPINTALRALNAMFGGPAKLLERAEESLKGKMLGYQREQEAAAAEARRVAEAAAQAERRRLEAEAAERQRESQAQAAAAAAAQAAGDEQAAQLAAAAAQRAEAEAQAAATSAQVVTAAAVAIAPPKAAGISTSTRIDFEVESLARMVAYIVTGNGDAPLAHPELLGLLQADTVRLRAYTKGLGAACNLPGMRVFEQRGMSARAAA
jgi:hypothetical protein